MQEGNKIDSSIITIGKWIIRFLMAVLTICLLLATAHLVKVIYDKISEPPFLLLDVNTLFEIFNLLLIIAVGYELIKSLLTIITSDTIPAADIMLIAIIALANKMITLDVKHTDAPVLYGLAAIMVSLGSTFFFLKRRSE